MGQIKTEDSYGRATRNIREVAVLLSGGVVKGEEERTSLRAEGRAQLSGERAKRATRKKEQRKRVASVFDSRYSSMRRAPTTVDLHHPPPPSGSEEEEERETLVRRKRRKAERELATVESLRRVLVGVA